MLTKALLNRRHNSVSYVFFYHGLFVIKCQHNELAASIVGPVPNVMLLVLDIKHYCLNKFIKTQWFSVECIYYGITLLQWVFLYDILNLSLW